jgi:hypothetical protein
MSQLQVLLVLTVILALPARAQKQEAAEFVPLVTPRSGVRCIKEKPEKGAFATYRFEIGYELASNWRQITVDYDSAGSPLSLQEMVARKTAKAGLSTYLLLVVFGPTRSMGRIGHEADPAFPTDSSFRRPVTQKEIQEARALGRLLWERRCP